jgi:hypothetical protein
MRRVLLDKLIVVQVVKKLPAFYGTRRFITVLKVLATGPYPESNASSPHSPIIFP